MTDTVKPSDLRPSDGHFTPQPRTMNESSWVRGTIISNALSVQVSMLFNPQYRKLTFVLLHCLAVSAVQYSVCTILDRFGETGDFSPHPHTVNTHKHFPHWTLPQGAVTQDFRQSWSKNTINSMCMSNPASLEFVELSQTVIYCINLCSSTWTHNDFRDLYTFIYF